MYAIAVTVDCGRWRVSLLLRCRTGRGVTIHVHSIMVDIIIVAYLSSWHSLHLCHGDVGRRWRAAESNPCRSLVHHRASCIFHYRSFAIVSSDDPWFDQKTWRGHLLRLPPDRTKDSKKFIHDQRDHNLSFSVFFDVSAVWVTLGWLVVGLPAACQPKNFVWCRFEMTTINETERMQKWFWALDESHHAQRLSR